MKKHKPEMAVIYGATTPRKDKNVFRLPIYTAGIWDLEKLRLDV
jgi:hypothetical protein